MKTEVAQVLIDSWAEQTRMLLEGKPTKDIARAAMNGANRLLDLHHEGSVPPVPEWLKPCGGWGFYMTGKIPKDATHILFENGPIEDIEDVIIMPVGQRVRPIRVLTPTESTEAALEYVAEMKGVGDG